MVRPKARVEQARAQDVAAARFRDAVSRIDAVLEEHPSEARGAALALYRRARHKWRADRRKDPFGWVRPLDQLKHLERVEGAARQARADAPGYRHLANRILSVARDPDLHWSVTRAAERAVRARARRSRGLAARSLRLEREAERACRRLGISDIPCSPDRTYVRVISEAKGVPPHASKLPPEMAGRWLHEPAPWDPDLHVALVIEELVFTDDTSLLDRRTGFELAAALRLLRDPDREHLNDAARSVGLLPTPPTARTERMCAEAPFGRVFELLKWRRLAHFSDAERSTATTYRSLLRDELLPIAEFVAECLLEPGVRPDDDGVEYEHLEGSEEDGRSPQAPKALSPYLLRVAQALALVESEKPDVHDPKAQWAWLREHGCPAYDDHVFPAMDSWLRYVRAVERWRERGRP